MILNLWEILRLLLLLGKCLDTCFENVQCHIAVFYDSSKFYLNSNFVQNNNHYITTDAITVFTTIWESWKEVWCCPALRCFHCRWMAVDYAGKLARCRNATRSCFHQNIFSSTQTCLFDSGWYEPGLHYVCFRFISAYTFLSVSFYIASKCHMQCNVLSVMQAWGLLSTCCCRLFWRSVFFPSIGCFLLHLSWKKSSLRRKKYFKCLFNVCINVLNKTT